MSDSTTHIDGIVQGQGSQDLAANAFFDAASPATLGGRRASTCSGLVWGYYGGKVSVAGVITAIANGTLSLSSSLTNYIEMHPDTGVISKNTTAFTPGYLPLYSVIAGASTVTSWVDQRASWTLNDALSKALSDANTTLTQPEAACSTLTFTGALTATRSITIPLVGNKQWTVYNGTGQSLQFIGPTGTGITVATLKHAILRSDGTNIVRVTADT